MVLSLKLLSDLRGDEDFEEQLVEYHSRTKAKKPKADPKSISSARTLAGQSGDCKRKREGGENGDHQRKGGDRMQQQAAGRAANVEDKRKAGREGGRHLISETTVSRFIRATVIGQCDLYYKAVCGPFGLE